MKPYHDKLHRDLVFQVDEWVWLRLHHHLATGITDSSKSKVPPPTLLRPVSGGGEGGDGGLPSASSRKQRRSHIESCGCSGTHN
jgi:hypothetical protein